MIRFDFDEWDRAVRRLGASIEQVPFTLSVALNDATRKAADRLAADTWARHVEVRNRNFARYALRINQRANKRNLMTEIIENPALAGRGNFGMQATGGTKRARKGKLAIPLKGSVQRTARGVRANQRPAAVIARTPKRALRVTDRGILVGEKGRLRLKFSLEPQARQPAHVPMGRDFQSYMRDELRAALPAAIAKAMGTRRR
ncbi:hypothetical protein [Methylobacterium dankookense]|uniref:Uncharacterized protein n=1 Tax=Methylobacterium dankookense TaxID=560405 RepID=A0A564G6E5_9HYPH|nr:hypothetical protein [Methylobacterium dankookense]GJD59713.1 hypothetical protein IFDJLNFL_5644 [Methylobacterium dankookense]VUF16109.1 hypothetical protein MTDSW087_05860 [Methylobacterium dankookense]